MKERSVKQKSMLSGAALAVIAAFAYAQSPPPAGGAAPAGPTPAERAIEYRQAVFKIVSGNFGPLAQVAQGKAEFKAETATKQAARLAQIATFVGDAHPDISKEGKTRALPEIWSKPDDFTAAQKLFADKVGPLAAAVKAKDVDAIGKAFREVGGSCKNCHDGFRAPE